MNLAEYRHELREAHQEYRDTLDKAATILSERLAAANAEFTGDTAKAIDPGDRPARRDL